MKDELGILEYADVTLESGGCMVPIRLKFTDESISYKVVKTGKLEEVIPKNIAVVNWQRLGGSYGVRIFTNDGSLIRFGGFRDNDQSKLEKFFKNSYGKTMTSKEFSVKGWNYGATEFYGDVMAFNVGGHIPAFEVPLMNVSNCITGKNEVTMEFHQNEDAPVSLMEMRLHIPSSEIAGEDQVESFKEKVMRKASVLTISGEALAIFSQIQCLTPRGRYDFKVYPSFIQLHGKTFDFKIPIETVLRLFLLPHLDGRQHFFVMSLDPPIKQGQTRYPYLIMLFNNDETDSVELPLTDEEIKEKYDGKLEREYNGCQHEVMSRLYKGLCQRKIVTPGNFIGGSGSPAVSCSYKAAAGYLYPLERGFIYIHKPPVHIKFDEVSSITFARSGSTTRSFDFEVACKNSTIHTFSSIEKGEHGRLYEYCKSKRLPIKDGGGKMKVHSKDSASDGAHVNDPYMNRVKDEAKEREDSEDESSEDEDFNPGEEGSDIAEEFDSNASSSAGSDESEEEKSPVKQKPKKEEKKSKPKPVSEKPRKKRKEKKVKDENKPKRPQSAYFLWLNEHREQIKRENPGISITEISKKAGVMWKEVTDKSEWEAKAAKGKKAYEEAMKEYKASGLAPSKQTPVKKHKQSKSLTVSPSKAGSGSGFKSKEYIEDSDSSDSDKPLNELKSSAKKKSPKKKPKKESSSEEEMEVDTD